MNTGVHVSLSDLVSSVCMPRSGIAGSDGSSISRKTGIFVFFFILEGKVSALCMILAVDFF